MTTYVHHFAGWTVILAILLLIAYFTRARLLRALPSGVKARLGVVAGGEGGSVGGGSANRSLYSRLPTYDWSRSRLAGLHSTLFDIEANIRDGDGRVGLEGGGAQEVERLMSAHNVDFDTARLMLNKQRFSKNNIDPRTGMPLDSKAVTFENLR